MPSPDSKDALLADCSMERLKLIAKNMQLTSFSRLMKEALINLIHEAMLRVTSCPTCGGGQCQPEAHYFAPVQPNPSSNLSSPDKDLMDNVGGGADLTDEFFDGPAQPFVPGQVTQPDPPPNLDAAIRQGGLDTAAVHARDIESQNGQVHSPPPVDPIERRIQEALAAEAAALAEERQQAAVAHEQEILKAQQERDAKAAEDAQFQARLEQNRQLLHKEHQHIMANEEAINNARLLSLAPASGSGHRPPAPTIRPQPPTPARPSHPSPPVAIPAPRPAAPSQFLQPPPSQFHPDTLSPPAAPGTAWLVTLPAPPWTSPTWRRS